MVMPTQFGHFKIDEELGRGILGPVYKAIDTRLNRVVALKVLTMNSNPRSFRRMKVEADVLGRLNRPDFIEIYEFSQFDNVPYIAMEYIADSPLSKLDNTEALPPLVVLRRVILLANTLSALHSHDVVHRNLKASNLFLVDNMLKIGDVGLARIQSDEDSLTLTADSSENSAYTAPEILLNEAAIDARADVYSLSALAFEWATGAPPFSGATQEVINANIVDHKIQYSENWYRLPASLRELIKRGISRKPADRFESAAELLKSARVVERKILTTQQQVSRSIWFLRTLCLLSLIWLALAAVYRASDAQKVDELQSAVTELKEQQQAIVENLDLKTERPEDQELTFLEVELVEIEGLLQRKIGGAESLRAALRTLARKLSRAVKKVVNGSDAELALRARDILLRFARISERRIELLGIEIERRYCELWPMADELPASPETQVELRIYWLRSYLRVNGPDNIFKLQAMRSETGQINSRIADPALRRFNDIQLQLFANIQDDRIWSSKAQAALELTSLIPECKNTALRTMVCDHLHGLTNWLASNKAIEGAQFQSHCEEMRERYLETNAPLDANSLDYALVFAPISSDFEVKFKAWSKICSAFPHDQYATAQCSKLRGEYIAAKSMKGEDIDVRDALHSYFLFLDLIRKKESVESIFRAARRSFVLYAQTYVELCRAIVMELEALKESRQKESRQFDFSAEDEFQVEAMRRYIKTRESKPAKMDSVAAIVDTANEELKQVVDYLNYLQRDVPKSDEVSNFFEALFVLRIGMGVSHNSNFEFELNKMSSSAKDLELVYPCWQYSLVMQRVYDDVFKRIICEAYSREKHALNIEIHKLTTKKLLECQQLFSADYGEPESEESFVSKLQARSKQVLAIMRSAQRNPPGK